MGNQMVTLIPRPPRSPRVRAPILNQNPHLSNYRRTHPLYLIIPHVVNDRSIRPVPPNTLPSALSLLGNPLAIPPHLARSLVPFLTLFLEIPPNLATRVTSRHPRAHYTYSTATAKFQGAGATLPTTTLLPLLSPTFLNPNNPPLHHPFSTTSRRVSPGITPVRRASSLLRNRLT